MAALCFVLVLGSLVPCLPEFSSSSQTVKEDPVAADSVYTASQSEWARLCYLSQAIFPQHQLPDRSQTREWSQVLGGRYLLLCPHFANGETEALKGHMIYSMLVVELGLQCRPPNPNPPKSGSEGLTGMSPP